jgi:hypothetical protein
MDIPLVNNPCNTKAINGVYVLPCVPIEREASHKGKPKFYKSLQGKAISILPKAHPVHT